MRRAPIVLSFWAFLPVSGLFPAESATQTPENPSLLPVSPVFTTQGSRIQPSTRYSCALAAGGTGSGQDLPVTVELFRASSSLLSFLRCRLQGRTGEEGGTSSTELVLRRMEMHSIDTFRATCVQRISAFRASASQKDDSWPIRYVLLIRELRVRIPPGLPLGSRNSLYSKGLRDFYFGWVHYWVQFLQIPPAV